MAGCSIVVLWLLAMPVMILGATAGFGLLIYLVSSWVFESIFCASVCENKRGWIPLWGQYQLGRIAGTPVLGAALMADHLALFGLCCASGFADPEFLGWVLLVFAVTGVVLKAVVAHRLYKIAAPERYKILSVISILTLGLLRPIFLFALRKKVCMFSKNT